MNYKILKHTADLEIKVWGKSLPELFKNAAEAMFAAMCGKAKTPNLKTETKRIEISGRDYESLLVNFLNELIFIADVNNEGFRVDDIRIENGERLKLKAGLVPYPLPPLEIEVKGATYHGLTITRVNDTFKVNILFDI